MEVADAVRRLGGVASADQLIALTSRRRLRTAVARGTVVRLSAGRYGLPDLARDRRRAAELAATLSHLGAAQALSWPVKHVPDRPWVTVPRHRHLARRPHDVELFYADLSDDERSGGVTAPLRTVLDCARALPFDEGLAVADSALRAGAVTSAALVEAAYAVRGPGTPRVRRVASAADGRAANPFESVLRAHALDAGLAVVPQVPVPTRGLTYRPDLVDEEHRIAIEADSWGFHSEPEVHERDCVRHTALSLAGWTLLRFTWLQTMRSPSYVRAVLEDAARRAGVRR